MKRRWVVLIVLGVSFFLLAYIGLIVWLFTQIEGVKPFESGGRKIALIRIEGVISASGGDLFSTAAAPPEDIIDQLRQADKDKGVKAILLRINSPGGTPAAAQEIFTELKRVKKPVVVSIADMGASAAYYIAAGADKIMASPGSEVGSIGVILMVPNLEELYRKLGIEYQVITQGKYKDMFAGNRPLTEEEKKLLEEEGQIVYNQFIEAVAEGRKLALPKVKDLATGRTWPGSEAKKLKLLDELGNYQDAIDLAKKLGKIKGEPEVVEYGEPTFVESILEIFQKRTLKLEDFLLPKDLIPTPNK